MKSRPWGLGLGRGHLLEGLRRDLGLGLGRGHLREGLWLDELDTLIARGAGVHEVQGRMGCRGCRVRVSGRALHRIRR